jgi:DNA/RNA endonuclease YhcR with UshA esterase domain
VILLLAGALTAQAQLPPYAKVVSLSQLQAVSRDSLVLLDSLQSATAGRTLDDSRYWHGADANADTVAITGVVIVAPRTLTYTLARFNMYIQDSTGGMTGLNVLTDDTLSAAKSTGITALDTGMVVTIVARVTEFGSQNNSLSEAFAYKSGFFTAVTPIQILGYWNNTTFARPAPIPVTVDSFAVGTKPMPSRGEKFESMYMRISNVTVVSVNTSSGAFTFQDSLGNQMSMYDGSGWYTYRGHKLSGSRYSAPPVGTKLKYIQGVIVPQTKSGTCGDYQIMPLYPGPKEKTGSTYAGDIAIDRFAPSITTIRRTPTPPHSTDAVTVTWQAKDLNTSGQVDSTFLNYKLQQSGAWVSVKAPAPTFAGADTLYHVVIPPGAKDSIVSYYVSAYAGGIYGTSPDATIPNYYRVRDTDYSIYDIQYTPYTNGVPGFSFDTLTVRGTIISDTSSIKEFPTSGAQSGRPSLWLQSGSGGWNGVCIWGATAAVGIDTLRIGDSVSVTGVVYDYNGRTVLKVTAYTMIRRGATVPAPNVVSISGAGSLSYQLSNPPVSGASPFEQWEGTLIQITNPYMMQRNSDDATNGSNSCFGEFFISSANTGSSSAFGLRVNDNGINEFYADTNAYYLSTRYGLDHPQTPNLKKTLIRLGQRISYLRGILDYSFSFYKLEPRTNADFGTITSVLYEDPTAVVRSYELLQNYPNPFNPATTIRYTVPVGGRVELKVFNTLGQVVETLVDQEQKAGAYVVTFDASRLATGMYLYALRSGDFRMVKKMLLVK